MNIVLFVNATIGFSENLFLVIQCAAIRLKFGKDGLHMQGEHSKLHGRRFFLDNNIPSVKIRRADSTIPGTDAAEAEALPDDTMDLTYS